MFQTSTVTTGSAIGAGQRSENSRGIRYFAGTGRVRAISTTTRDDTLFYDAEGNTEFSRFKADPGAVPVEDRASYYDGAGRLRAVDHRLAIGGGGSTFNRSARFTFEEFRYDALGRRVLARMRRWCQAASTLIVDVECDLQTIRRTIWDGSQELYEIQMPGADSVSASTLESDTQAPQQPIAMRAGYFDPNPFFGRVAYAHGAALDQPLSITRLDYSDKPNARPFVRWLAFTLVPHWNQRGQADNGSFEDGASDNCMNDGIDNFRCIRVQWPFGWTAYQQRAYVRVTWHGTLVEQKRDGSGMLFRRNRYVDPATGRFTQEDPIGLAGGVNLYGFADGDPVNFSDAFGLCPDPKNSSVCIDDQPLIKVTGDITAAKALLGITASGWVARLAGLVSLASEPTAINISRSRYPESAKHIEDAQAGGQPSVLTIDRAGAAQRRVESLRGVPRRKGSDRDEYPPAMFREGGEGASVRYISPADNRGAGACMGGQCRALPDGSRVVIRITPDE